ncbi:hypothetical protein PR048_030839 [Dryococelus australis]|uniref:DDE Tnp4 domain-containing protein n=1 Tax=Dryococelus australis TaxID=614101 RepID=A0ABQ9GAS4_9NEOP|nr:hypothetical protein PR048_030839 [Dryococelus australis]
MSVLPENPPIRILSETRETTQNYKVTRLNFQNQDLSSQQQPGRVPYVIIGDEGSGRSQFVLRPYGGRFLTVEKKVFNYRLTRARRYVECCFGIFSDKWIKFHRALSVEPYLTESIIKSCCHLDNFVRERDGVKFEDTLTARGFAEGMPVDNSNTDNNARCTRAIVTDYFLNEGALEWQMQKI